MSEEWVCSLPWGSGGGGDGRCLGTASVLADCRDDRSRDADANIRETCFDDIMNGTGTCQLEEKVFQKSQNFQFALPLYQISGFTKTNSGILYFTKTINSFTSRLQLQLTIKAGHIS